MPCYTYERRATTSLYKNVGGKRWGFARAVTRAAPATAQNG